MVTMIQQRRGVEKKNDGISFAATLRVKKTISIRRKSGLTDKFDHGDNISFILLIKKLKVDVLNSHPDLPALYVSKGVCLFEEQSEIQDGGSNDFI